MASPVNKDEYVSCACWNRHITYKFRRCGLLTLTFAMAFLIAIVLPYIVAMARNSMPAFLPFISYAGGIPPMCGVFAVGCSFMAFVGVIFFVLLHETIHHRNIYELKKIRIVNHCALLIGIGFCLGWIIVIANPEGYTGVPSKFEWVITVLLEHGIGAALALIGMVIFHFLITWIWFLLPDVTKAAKYIKLAISIIYISIFFIVAKSMHGLLYEELGPEPFNIQLLKNSPYERPPEFSTNLKISAFCEWTACFLSIAIMLSLIPDMKKVSFRVVLLRDPYSLEPVCVVILEQKAVSEFVSIKVAVAVWFSCYYVYNLRYPIESAATLEFIQRVFLDINPEKGTKQAKRYGKRTNVHTKVLKLVSQLSQYKNMWHL